MPAFKRAGFFHTGEKAIGSLGGFSDPTSQKTLELPTSCGDKGYRVLGCNCSTPGAATPGGAILKTLLQRRLGRLPFAVRSLLAVITLIVVAEVWVAAVAAPPGWPSVAAQVLLGAVALLIWFLLLRQALLSFGRVQAMGAVTSDAIVVVSTSGLIESFNPAATRLFGWSEREVAGKQFQILMAESERERHRSRFERDLRDPEGRFPCALGEILHVRRDGSTFVAEVTLSAMVSWRSRMIVAVLRDVTKREQATQLMAALLDASPDAMLVVGPKGVVQRINRQAELLFGYSRDELIGQPLGCLLPERFRASHARHVLDYVGGSHRRTVMADRRLVALRKGGEEFPADISISSLAVAEGIILIATIRDATARIAAEKKLRQERGLLRAIIDNVPDYIYAKDTRNRFLIANGTLAKRMGAASADELIGKTDFDYYPEEVAAEYAKAEQEVMRSGRPVINREESSLAANGKTVWMLTSEVPFRDESSEVAGLVGVGRDITERKSAEDELAQSVAELAHTNQKLQQAQAERDKVEAELRLAQKLEAIGQLAAGIAHEINTPMQYIGDSVHFLRQSFEDLLRILDAQQEAHQVLGSGPVLEADMLKVSEAEDNADLDYIRERVPRALERTLEGIERVTSIVRAMKEFAHPDSAERSSIDINRALSNALVVSRNEYKYVAEVETGFGALPPVPCHAGELNQVFLNLLVNAAHAIGDVVKGSDRKGVIRVRTAVDGDTVVIQIQDTGTGIPEEIRNRIFDPFFTTKPVGKGTGQGLAIARSIVVGKHRGALTFTSEVGRGTTFTIRLPLAVESGTVGGVEAHEEANSVR